MADFTTWAALKTQILNEMSNGSVLTKHYSLPTGASRTFHDLAQVMDFLKLCDLNIMAEGGSDGRDNLATFGRPV